MSDLEKKLNYFVNSFSFISTFHFQNYYFTFKYSSRDRNMIKQHLLDPFIRYHNMFTINIFLMVVLH